VESRRSGHLGAHRVVGTGSPWQGGAAGVEVPP
jgi:hypothetical protein